MARVNDNLFTTSRAAGGSVSTACRVGTPWGVLEGRFAGGRLTRLRFEAGESAEGEGDPAFLAWLRAYESAPPEARWERLAPRGTAFQQAVWRELFRLPRGRRIRYGQLAERLGRPTAARAVGAAVGANPIAVLVPCHRVVPASGGTGRYRWGAERKAALLEAETAPDFALARLCR